MRKPLRNQLETWMTRFAFAVIPRLSRPCVVRMARLLGSLSFIFSRHIKRIGIANLDIAFGDTKSKQQKDDIMRASLQNMSLVLLDTFWFSRHTEDRLRQFVSFDRSFAALFTEKPQVGITAHFGNWEVLGQSVTQRGFPMHSVANPLKNKKVDALFVAARLVSGQKIIKRKGAVRAMLSTLKQGKKIALVMDQNTKLSEGGEMIPFFGLPASVSTAGSALAIKTRSNIIIATMIPKPDGTYFGDYCEEIDITPYTHHDLSEDASALTAVMVQRIEKVIRAKPEYWLWAYKRWKYVPKGDDADRYPFYRRPAV